LGYLGTHVACDTVDGLAHAGRSCYLSHTLQQVLVLNKIWGKILVRRSEFDRWMEGFRRHPPQYVSRVVDEVLAKFRR
jgi:hypothetical protein